LVRRWIFLAWGRISGLESGLAGPGAELFAKKKHQHENGDNFCIWTPFSMNLGSLESPQRAL
jgi:hypothetical protein